MQICQGTISNLWQLSRIMLKTQERYFSNIRLWPRLSQLSARSHKHPTPTTAKRKAGSLPPNLKRTALPHISQPWTGHMPSVEQPPSGKYTSRKGAPKPGRPLTQGPASVPTLRAYISDPLTWCQQILPPNQRTWDWFLLLWSSCRKMTVY